MIDSIFSNLKKTATNSASEHLAIKKRTNLKKYVNNVGKEAVDKINALRNITLQNLSISDIDKYEAQRKITNKIIRRKKRLCERK